METEKQKARRKQWEECISMAGLVDDSSGKRPSNIGPSDFVLDLIEQEIRGEITIDEAIEMVKEKHAAKWRGINENA